MSGGAGNGGMNAGYGGAPGYNRNNYRMGGGGNFRNRSNNRNNNGGNRGQNNMTNGNGNPAAALKAANNAGAAGAGNTDTTASNAATTKTATSTLTEQTQQVAAVCKLFLISELWSQPNIFCLLWSFLQLNNVAQMEFPCPSLQTTKTVLLIAKLLTRKQPNQATDRRQKGSYHQEYRVTDLNGINKIIVKFYLVL